MRRITVAAAAERRLKGAGSFLRELLDPGSEAVREVLILAPTRGAADDLLRRICPPGSGLFGVHRATPGQLAAELATRPLAAAGKAPVTGLGAEALAARAISIRHDAGELDYFAPVAETPGFARALAATLREVRAGAVDGGVLAATGDPGRDLARLLATFEEELDRWSLVDGAGLLRLAAAEIEGDGSEGVHRLLGLPLLLLDLSPRSRLEQRFLGLLAAAAPAVLATVPAGDRTGVEALEELLGTGAEELDGGSLGKGATRLDRLRRRIFQPHLGAEPAEDEDETTSGDDPSVAFISAPGEGRECVEIARRLSQLASSGIPFDRMAVLLRDPEGYLPLLEEALGRAEVPAYFTRGTVRPHPAGRALLALLACAAERLSASRFAEYLSLGQVPPLGADGAPAAEVEVPWVPQEGDQLVFKSLMPPSEPEPPPPGDDLSPAPAGTLLTPRRWERLLVDAAVLGGRDRWQRRLSGLEAEIRLQLKSLDGDDHPRRRRLERQLEQLRNLERFALPVIGALAELPAEASWGRWLDHLEELAGRVLRQPERVLPLLAELRPMEEVGPVTLDEVRRVLEERLTFLRAEPPARRYGRVLVATVDEARGRSFEAVFLPGLAEGIFPRRAHEDPLLLDDYRRRLEEPLATQEERVEEERLLLRIAAGAARSRLIVSYPNLDSLQGRSRVPSFYALDLLRAAEGRLPDLGRLEARAAEASRALLGWPAPKDPETAIDDTEYDLAILEPLLRRSQEEVRGRGRYLLLTNDRLDRSLRARYRRWRKVFSPADGVVDPDAATLDALAPHRLRRRSYSPTALQRYAACPYRFLLAAIHELRPREEAEQLERLDPLTRGSLFHEVQFELFGELRERELLPMREDDLAALRALADEVLDRVAGRYEEELAPAIPRVWRSEVEELRTDLQGWIRSVVAAAEPWRPAHFELAFGFEEEAVVLDGKRLRGAIDLVETHPDRGTVRITDHKTGSLRHKKNVVVGGGEILQPLLYALAAETLLELPAEAGRLSYCTRRGGYEDVTVRVDDRNREAVSLVLDVVDRAVQDGFLPAAPQEGACRYCDYRLICGPHEERRIRRKHPQRLVMLQQLRDLP